MRLERLIRLAGRIDTKSLHGSIAVVSSVRKTKRSGSKPRVYKGAAHLVIVTGMAGSGKASTLEAFEDLCFYCVDNLPIGVIPGFGDLVKQSEEIQRPALVTDIREHRPIRKLPPR